MTRTLKLRTTVLSLSPESLKKNCSRSLKYSYLDYRVFYVSLNNRKKRNVCNFFYKRLELNLFYEVNPFTLFHYLYPLKLHENLDLTLKLQCFTKETNFIYVYDTLKHFFHLLFSSYYSFVRVVLGLRFMDSLYQI